MDDDDSDYSGCLGVLIVFILAVAIVAGAIYSSLQISNNTKASSDQYQYVLDIKNLYPELHPLINQAVKDNVLTYSEYKMIREAYRDLNREAIIKMIKDPKDPK